MRGRLLMTPAISHGEHEEIETCTKRERATADGGFKMLGLRFGYPRATSHVLGVNFEEGTLASSNLRMYQVSFICTSPRGLNPGSWPEKARVIRQVQNQSVVCSTHSESLCIFGLMVDPEKPGDSPTRPVLKREIHLSPRLQASSLLETEGMRYLYEIKMLVCRVAFLHLLPAVSRFRFCPMPAVS